MVEPDDQDVEVLDGEVFVEQPREGTLAWLELQEHTLFQGLEIPECNRVPDGSTLHPEVDGRCRVVRPSGERCKATATRRYTLCLVHAGGGGFSDPSAASRRGHAMKATMRSRRLLLGIGARRSADPRQIARLAALDRADEVAAGLLAPLDDGDLGSMARQAAAIRILDATFPIQTVEVEVSLPASSDDVASLSWEAMQQLAAQLLGTQSIPIELEPA